MFLKHRQAEDEPIAIGIADANRIVSEQGGWRSLDPISLRQEPAPQQVEFSPIGNRERGKIQRLGRAWLEQQASVLRSPEPAIIHPLKDQPHASFIERRQCLWRRRTQRQMMEGRAEDRPTNDVGGHDLLPKFQHIGKGAGRRLPSQSAKNYTKLLIYGKNGVNLFVGLRLIRRNRVASKWLTD
jgi:hypothetical protein